MDFAKPLEELILKRKKYHNVILTLSAPSISESCLNMKINLNFYFHTSLQCLKRFFKAFQAFIKSFEAPQGSVKIKFKLLFSLRQGSERERLIFNFQNNHIRFAIDYRAFLFLASFLTFHSSVSLTTNSLCFAGSSFD